MGRSGNRRRKPAKHLPKVEGASETRTFQHSPYSYEGAIESYGMFARGTRGMSAAQASLVRRLFALTVAALVLICLAAWLVARIG
jgi:hypothetical protein